MQFNSNIIPYIGVGSLCPLVYTHPLTCIINLYARKNVISKSKGYEESKNISKCTIDGIMTNGRKD